MQSNEMKNEISVSTFLFCHVLIAVPRDFYCKLNGQQNLKNYCENVFVFSFFCFLDKILTLENLNFFII